LTQLLSKAAQRLIAEMRRKVQAHIGRLPLRFYDSNKTGTLVSRIMTDVEGIRNLIGTGLVEFIGGLVTALFSVIILLRISSLITGLTVLFIVIFAVVLQRAFQSIRPIFQGARKDHADVTGRLTETLGGVRVVKGYHAESREEEVFSGGVTRIAEQCSEVAHRDVADGFVGQRDAGTGGRHRDVLRHAPDLCGRDHAGRFRHIHRVSCVPDRAGGADRAIGTQLTEALAGLERTREVLRESREEDDPRRSVQLGPIDGHVLFEDVGFEYEAGKPVLHGFGFESSPGTVTALVGPSGSGKSTIIGLVAAFYTPTSGRVLVDGVDLSTVRLDSYRTQLGVVLQDTFLFDGTIRENVAFARPDSTEQEILEACRIARVDEFAERFELKYDTVVGERGVKLSGGQRQRVSIARAILANPRILILDEATSSLDSESEALIQEGLRFLMKGRTTFVIAHRLSTIRRADQILVVEDGRILERGNHDELYAGAGPLLGSVHQATRGADEPVPGARRRRRNP
jgi:ABC-type multidrug transport system fused ATPase/permease subunit